MKHLIEESKNRVRWFQKNASICLPIHPPGCFLSHSCIVLAECLGRKERCNMGRTRKQESGWDHKNRKQKEAMIRWLLWCTLGFLLLWVIVCSPLNYREFRVIKAIESFRVQSCYAGQMCLTRESSEAVGVFVFVSFSNSTLIYVNSHLTLACSIIFCVSWCLSDHIHESLFVSGFQLGQWQAGPGISWHLPFPNALISLLVARSLLALAHCWSSLLALWPLAYPYCMYIEWR